jgi:hypothetical protein
MMAQRDSGLPEGTDTIVTGAMETDTGGSARQNRTRKPRSTASKTAASGSTGLMDKVRSGGGKLSDEAAGKARDLLGQGIERSAEALANVSKLVGDTASGLDERLGEDYGNYARKAAETLENTANSLASKDPDELIDDTRNFIRKSPGVALAGAAIVGFALARLVKSGFTSDDEDDEDGGSRSRRNRS